MNPADQKPSEAESSPGLLRRHQTLWLVVFAAFVFSWLGFFLLHPAALTKVGVGHYRIEVAPERFHEIWFLDTLAILASNDAAALGEDPYVPNRLDYLRRPHVYGPAWLHLRHFGLTRAHVVPVGLGLAAAFIVAATLLLRPRCARSLAWSLAVFCSIPVLAAIERGNNDLVVFVLLAPVVPLLLSGHAAMRWFAVPLVVLAAALKYYPVVAGLVLLAPAPAKEVRGRIAAGALGLALAGWHVLASVPGSVALPAPGGILSFGAVGVFHQLGVQAKWPQVAVVGLAVAAFAFWWRSPVLRDWRPGPSQRRDWLYFILGGVLLTGCFFVGQHFAYRWIFAIFLAPLLWSLPRESQTPPAARRLARVIGWLLLLMLWAEALFVFSVHRWPHDEMMRALNWMSVGIQPVTWAFFFCLLAFLAHFSRLAWSELRGGPVTEKAVPGAV